MVAHETYLVRNLSREGMRNWGEKVGRMGDKGEGEGGDYCLYASLLF
jgi:hypothetical protein